MAGDPDAGAVPGGKADHGWVGRGRVQMARLDGAVVIRINRLTTQGGRIQKPIRDFFRHEGRGLNKDYAGRYDVTIWIESAAENRKFDVDNVAKACLDALTGAIWRDDSQVVRLTVEKLAGDRDQVILHARPAGEAGRARLDTLLGAIGGGS